jgi:hypothetical protein
VKYKPQATTSSSCDQGTRVLPFTLAHPALSLSEREHDAHPFHELTLDAELEDAALGGVRGTMTLRRRQTARPLTRDELQRARRIAEAVGRTGEEFVLQHLMRLKLANSILEFAWISDTNAVAHTIS